MKIDDLTPEMIEVLRLVEEDGVEADLTDAQKDTRDVLENAHLVYGSGDEYDFDIYLTSEADQLLSQLNPNWWIAKRQELDRAIASVRLEIDNVPSMSQNMIEHWAKEHERKVENEKARLTKRMEYLRKELINREADYQEWLIENKSHLPNE